jgi:hypothetical protein
MSFFWVRETTRKYPFIGETDGYVGKWVATQGDGWQNGWLSREVGG